MSETLEAWDQAEQDQTSSLTVEAMDGLIQELREAKTKAEEAAEVEKQASGAYKEVRKRVMQALIALKRDNYSVDGHGLAYIARKEVYTTPKTNEDKNKLFTYIKEKYGPDALMSLVSINSQTLTSWANKETETGEVQAIPGLDQPTMVETLNFRKK